MANPSPLEARPRLVKGGARSPESASEARRPGVSALVWVLAGLLALALGAVALQTERLDRMSERADLLAARSEVLQLELASAQTQIHDFEIQQALVRESVADLAERIAALYEIVRPVAAPAPERPAEPAR